MKIVHTIIKTIGGNKRGRKIMMNTLKKYSIALAVLVACTGAAFADGNAFTPINFDDTSYSSTPPSTTPNFANLSSSNSAAGENANVQSLPGNSKMQNAILELDNAQIDVRNDLLNYKAKYADIDAQYQVLKSERKALSKQIKDIERRIKKIEKDKANIKKNML